jgi:hypothetical protein
MNRFIGSLAIGTTLSYHYYKITETHKQLTLSGLTDELHTHWTLLTLLNLRIYHESPLCKLDTDCIENTSSDVLLEAVFIVQFPSNKL